MSTSQKELLETLAVQFSHLRDSHCKTYPVEVWKDALALTKTISMKEVCLAISVQPAYLKKKIQEIEPVKRASDFVEIHPNKPLLSNNVIIDLETPNGFKAKIQGSSYCLGQVLAGLFQEASCSK